MKKKLRPLGEITQDMEPLLFEMGIDHDMQRGEILAQFFNWVTVHIPGSIEYFEKDNTEPVFFYGHRSQLKKMAKRM